LRSACRSFWTKKESNIHSHAEEECIDLLHAIDNGSTELEVLNFIHALLFPYSRGFHLFRYRGNQ